jgi:hypothetical protein
VKTCIWLISLIVVLAALPPAAQADDASWKLPNLNPFSTKGKPPTSSRISNSAGGGWKMPQLWPAAPAAKSNRGQANRNAIGRNTAGQAPPSVWQKMTSGTKSVVSKTADALNPWDDANDKVQPPKPSGSGSAFSRATAKQSQKSGSILPTSWWPSDEKNKQPTSVNEFLSQQRP